MPRAHQGWCPVHKGVTPSRRAGIHLPKERTKKGKRERGERGEAKKGGPETQEAECAQSGRGQGCNSRSKGQEHTKRESTFSSPIPKAPCLGCCHRRIISGLVVYMVVHASRFSHRSIRAVRKPRPAPRTGHRRSTQNRRVGHRPSPRTYIQLDLYKYIYII